MKKAGMSNKRYKDTTKDRVCKQEKLDYVTSVCYNKTQADGWFCATPFYIGKTTRLSSQAFQVIAQTSIITFYRIGLTFTHHTFMVNGKKNQGIKQWKGIVEIFLRSRTTIQTVLHVLKISFRQNIPTQNASGVSVYNFPTFRGLFLGYNNVHEGYSLQTWG